ncbi:MAG TPA: hypothetical protein VFT50_13725 [Baekduia sp.]|nr:hypothetical protein [Baekduia sp.]
MSTAPAIAASPYDHPATAQPLAAHHFPDVMRETAVRATVAVGLGAVGVIHLLDAIGKWSETRYVFWMYLALIAGTIVTAGAVLLTRSRLALAGAAGLAGSAAAGYALSRTTGLPNATEDIGNWTEPLGLASLFVEGGIVALVAAYLTLPAGRR